MKQHKMRIVISTLSIIIFLIISTYMTSARSSDEITTIIIDNSVDNKIQSLMQEYDVPSLSAGIIINDSLVWAKGYGHQTNLDTVYMVGSILKPFIATAILQLKEKGFLTLNDDVSKYLPFEIRHPGYPSVPISIQMCLSHRSSLIEFPDQHLYRDYNAELASWVIDTLGWEVSPWTTLSLKEYMMQVVQPSIKNESTWLPNEPGTTYKYSNSGLQLLLPLIIENVTHQRFIDYISEKILTPLQMLNSGFNGTEFSLNHAIPYLMLDNTNHELPQEYYLGSYTSPDLRCSLPDLSKFMIAHMNYGVYKGVQLLQPESIDLMHTKHTAWVYKGNNWAYGLGWEWKFGGQGHGGAIPGFLADFLFKKENNQSTGILLMINRGSSWVLDDEILNDFRPLVRTLLFQEADRMTGSTTQSASGFEIHYLLPGFIFVFFSYRIYIRKRKYPK